jgi:hypothetical protein
LTRFHRTRRSPRKHMNHSLMYLRLSGSA